MPLLVRREENENLNVTSGDGNGNWVLPNPLDKKKSESESKSKNKLDIPQIENISYFVEKIKKGELKAFDLVKEHLDRAYAINPYINAFITILDEALEKAKEIDAKIARGEVVGSLAGIPFTVKDLYLVEGTKTTFGSKYMQDFIAPYTATVVKKCIDEGAILICKCNCDPWGFGGSGENSGYGPTKNPLDFSRVPGGSSSGSAASLLSGVGFFSLGTDTGGSVRLPASFCGLYSLKPTYGRNSRYGIGAMASSFDTPGFFARHLEDIQLLQGVMAGKDEYDPSTYDVPVFQTSNIERQTSNVKIGLPKEFFEGLSDDIKSAINEKIDVLKSKGFEVKEVSIPSMKFGLAVYYILVPAEISSNRARYDGVRFGPKESNNYDQNLIEGRSKYFEAEVKRRIMIGTYSLSAGYADQFYKKASMVRTKLKREFDNAFKEVDVLISPIAAETAFKLGAKSDDPVAMYLTDIYTVTANIVGIPSLAIPSGKSKVDNMPIGLQIMGKKFDETTIFEIAKELVWFYTISVERNS